LASAEDNPDSVLKDFDPILFLDCKNRWRGLDVDLANALGKKLDVEFVFKDVEPLRSLGAVRNQRVDLAMSVSRTVWRVGRLSTSSTTSTRAPPS
jgi:ABC-type amino acid transport substrate-binding protein